MRDNKEAAAKELNIRMTKLGIKLPYKVEDCANWTQIMVTHGHHCYNCAARLGYLFRAHPSPDCVNFKPVKQEKKK